MQKVLGWVEEGNVFVSVSGLISSSPFQGSFPSATVTVYLTGTVTLASLFSDDNTTPTALANPFTAGTDGKFGFYVADGRYDLVFSGGGIVTPFSLGDVQAFDVRRPNLIREASQFVGADFGAKVAAAIADLPITGGTVDARGLEGAQSSSTTIAVPQNVVLLMGATTLTSAQSPAFQIAVANNGASGRLIGSGGSTLINYTGSSHAIEAFTDTGAQSFADPHIESLRIVGTSSGLSGLHLKAFNEAVIRELEISGFSNGDGVFNEGANAITYTDVFIRNNKNGVHNVGVVVNGVNYSVNACKFIGGQIARNTAWGVWEDAALSATVGANIGNVYTTTFQDNGTTGVTASGNVFFQQAYGCKLIGGYAEYAAVSPTSNITIGDATNTPQGNQIIAMVFLSVGATNTISDVRSQNTTIFANQENAVVTNFVLRTINSSRPVVLCNSALAATNHVSGDNQNGDLLLEPSTAAMGFLGGFAPSLRGLAFQTITGLSATVGLAIRNNNTATNTVTWQDAAGNTVGAVTGAGLQTLKRTDNRQGTAQVPGDWGLSAGWGSTATVSGVNATDMGGSVVISSGGVGQGANPTITVTFKDGAFTTAQFAVTNRTDTNQPTVQFTQVSSTTTQLVLKFNGTPVAGETYGFNFWLIAAKS